jgi:transposase-like protein
MPLETPRHIRRLAPGLRGQAELKFKLRVVAIYGTPEGSFTALAERIGAHISQISYWIALQRLPPSVAEKCEKLVGRDVAPKEWLAPEAFKESAHAE